MTTILNIKPALRNKSSPDTENSHSYTGRDSPTLTLEQVKMCLSGLRQTWCEPQRKKEEIYLNITVHCCFSSSVTGGKNSWWRWSAVKRLSAYGNYIFPFLIFNAFVKCNMRFHCMSLMILCHVYISLSAENHMLWESLTLTFLHTQKDVVYTLNELNEYVARFGVCDSGIT